MILAASGHRPPKLGGYSNDATRKVVVFAEKYLEHTKPTSVISGMALGWDTAWAEAAIQLKIPVHAAVPFEGHHKFWGIVEKTYYLALLEQCTWITNVSPAWHSEVYQVRNKWMVNNSTKLIALWDGSPGGTSNCIKYARAVNHPWQNLWKEWSEYA